MYFCISKCMRINEIQAHSITVYHGDNHGTTAMDPKLMNYGNNQEGIGIYFGTLDTARGYGDKIASTTIDTANFLNSRSITADKLSIGNLTTLIQELNKRDSDFWYLFTDFGMDVEQDTVEEYHCSELAQALGDDELRNMQITLAERSNVELFVQLWNKIFPNVHGLYDDEFYAILNTNYKLTKVQ